LPLFNEQQGGTEQAVYVAVSLPPEPPNNNCYDNRAGTISQEWEAFQEFHDKVESTYCVDNNRIFVSGYSSGGWISNMFSCYFARHSGSPAQVPTEVRGAGARGSLGRVGFRTTCRSATGAVGALYLHDAGDTTNVIARQLLGP